MVLYLELNWIAYKHLGRGLGRACLFSLVVVDTCYVLRV